MDMLMISEGSKGNGHRKKVGVARKGNLKDVCDENCVLCLGCASVGVLVTHLIAETQYPTPQVKGGKVYLLKVVEVSVH